MKPWAIADKWEEHNPKVAPWDPDQDYDPTVEQGMRISQLLEEEEE